jgi:hypothetical protein
VRLNALPPAKGIAKDHQVLCPVCDGSRAKSFSQRAGATTNSKRHDEVSGSLTLWFFRTKMDMDDIVRQMKSCVVMETDSAGTRMLGLAIADTRL